MSVPLTRHDTALRIAGWSIAAALLALPAVAMQFTGEVEWTPFDFGVAALVLSIVGGMAELILRASASVAYRAGAALAVLAAFLLVWINLAVGIIGAEDDPRNLAYFVLVGIAACGAWVAWGRANELSRAMQAVTAAQVLVTLMHLGLAPMALPIDLFFAALWGASALLFARAARAARRP